VLCTKLNYSCCYTPYINSGVTPNSQWYHDNSDNMKVQWRTEIELELGALETLWMILREPEDSAIEGEKGVDVWKREGVGDFNLNTKLGGSTAATLATHRQAGGEGVPCVAVILNRGLQVSARS
jgi:hypothetical protein